MDWDFTKSKVGSNLQSWMRRLGYVDDLTRWTHGRCYDEIILEWCLGYNTQTRKKECGILQMDFQDKICCW